MTPEKIGAYPIEREVGRGGMGVVYLARDPRLDRRVAIKVLPDAFARDPDRLARFEREARLVASLNHPNIAGIYGLEESAEGHRFLALEYVEGETLAERLDRGALPVDEALDLCRQVAAALEAAHEGGVVHRDLKPGNIKVTPAGEVKVLDFGLAKSGTGAGTGSESAADLSQSPTLVQGMTGAGMILGTAAYMSPEQARGRAVDKRTDIWAFGCLLYECLTGRQAFAGETVSDMIARILQGEPDWNALPARTPERVRGLIRRCLEKDARRRLRDVGDARMEIEDVIAVRTSSSSISAASSAPSGTQRLVKVGTLVGVALLAAAVTWFVPRVLKGPAKAQPARFEVLQPEGVFLNTDGTSPVLSPDGRSLAFAASDSAGNGSIWVRSLESTVARPIPGAILSDFPFFWSPDGRQIAFASQEKLKRIAVAGGNAEVICSIKAERGGSWSRDGVILIAPYSNGCIYRVPASGGDPQPVTTLDSARGETAHRFPQFLPDGKHFLFSALPARAGKFDIYVGALDSPKRRLLLSAGSGVTLAPGHLLFARDGKLMAQAFDAKSLRLGGEPVSLGDVVTGTGRSGGPIVSASLTGTLAYGTLQVTNQRLAWCDYAGHEVASIPLAPGPYTLGSLSPDERRVALTRAESDNASDIWIADLERGVATRLTDEPGTNDGPIWSPDGTRIAYPWNDNSPQVLKVKSLVGQPDQTLLASDPLFKRIESWTPDGQGIVFSRLDPATQWDLWIQPLAGDSKPTPYLRTRFSETGGLISPDGRWMAYLSDESGQNEVYVQSYPVPGGKYQVTTGGGIVGQWTRDGRHLIFAMNSDPTHAFRAEVLPGAEFRLGPAQVALTIPKDVRGMLPADRRGQILAVFPAGKDPTSSLTVVLDGLPGASRK